MDVFARTPFPIHVATTSTTLASSRGKGLGLYRRLGANANVCALRSVGLAAGSVGVCAWAGSFDAGALCSTGGVEGGCFAGGDASSDDAVFATVSDEVLSEPAFPIRRSAPEVPVTVAVLPVTRLVGAIP